MNLVADITGLRDLAAERAQPDNLALPLDATVAMIEVAISVFAGMPWEASAFN